MIAVRDEDHPAAVRKLEESGFIQAPPDRRPAPEISESLPDPGAVVDEINEGYSRLDRCCTSFQLPHYDLYFTGCQIYLAPNSFAHLPMDDIGITSEFSNEQPLPARYQVHGTCTFLSKQHWLRASSRQRLMIMMKLATRRGKSF